MEIDGTNFKPVTTSGIKYVKPSELPTKEPLVGTYLGVVESQYGKNYKFTDKMGGTLVVNGCGSLHNAMANVKEGTLVALTYGGKQKLNSGKFKGKEFHQVTVSVAETGDGIPF